MKGGRREHRRGSRNSGRKRRKDRKGGGRERRKEGIKVGRNREREGQREGWMGGKEVGSRNVWAFFDARGSIG